MKALEEKILQEGVVVDGDILKVDGFVNHQVDVPLMEEIGKDMAEHFKEQGITKVFTIESSGIAPALFTAKELGVPLVILKKQQTADSLKTEVWQTEVVSYTKDTSYRLTLAKNYISDEDHVLIIDDFLANGDGSHRRHPPDPQGPCHCGRTWRTYREGLPAGPRKAGEPGHPRICPGQHPGV